MEINLSGFHRGTPRIGRENPNNGRSPSLYQDGSFRPLARNGYSNRRSTSIYEGNMEGTWPTHRYCLGKRHEMDGRILEGNLRPTRHQTETANSISPTDRRTTGTA